MKYAAKASYIILNVSNHNVSDCPNMKWLNCDLPAGILEQKLGPSTNEAINEFLKKNNLKENSI